MHSSWFVEFQRDLRTSLFRTVQVRKRLKDPELPSSCLWPCWCCPLVAIWCQTIDSIACGWRQRTFVKVSWLGMPWLCACGTEAHTQSVCVGGVHCFPQQHLPTAAPRCSSLLICRLATQGAS